MKTFLLLFGLLLSVPSVHAITFTGYIYQQIDHGDAQSGYFKQRYVIHTEYAENQNSPVLLYIGGEGREDNQTTITEDIAIFEYAKKIKAYVVGLEHRYYGFSQPFDRLTNDNLKFLTMDQALQDILTFQKVMQVQQKMKGKWVAFGSSYSGMLASLLRTKYPDAVVGAIASAAPFAVSWYNHSYEEFVAKQYGSQCAAKLLKAYRPLEDAILSKNQTEIERYRKLFQAKENLSSLEMLELASNVAIDNYADEKNRKDVCEAADSGLQGIANIYIKQLKESVDSGEDPFDLREEDPSKQDGYMGWRQWYFQLCSELGDLSVASKNRTLSVTPTLVDAEYRKQFCQSLFGVKPGDSFAENKKQQYDLNLNPEISSNIFFISGDQDAWFPGLYARENGNATNPNHYYYTIKGGGHGDEVAGSTDSDPNTMKIARLIVEKLLLKWTK